MIYASTAQRLGRAFIFALAMLGIASTFSVGCASFSDGAHRTKGSLAVGLLTATEAWQEVDLAKQRAILLKAPNRTEWNLAITEYRDGEQAKAAAAIRSARHSLGAFSAALDAYDAGAAKKPDVTRAISKAMAGAVELALALQHAGVRVDAAAIIGGSGGAK